MSVFLGNNGDVVITNGNGNALILTQDEAKELYDALYKKYGENHE